MRIRIPVKVLSKACTLTSNYSLRPRQRLLYCWYKKLLRTKQRTITKRCAPANIATIIDYYYNATIT
jgi:hypothetical protein